jgi:hypothetical protein
LDARAVPSAHHSALLSPLRVVATRGVTNAEGWLHFIRATGVKLMELGRGRIRGREAAQETTRSPGDVLQQTINTVPPITRPTTPSSVPSKNHHLSILTSMIYYRSTKCQSMDNIYPPAHHPPPTLQPHITFHIPTALLHTHPSDLLIGISRLSEEVSRTYEEKVNLAQATFNSVRPSPPSNIQSQL